jgi:hypothetical protein
MIVERMGESLSCALAFSPAHTEVRLSEVMLFLSSVYSSE